MCIRDRARALTDPQRVLCRPPQVPPRVAFRPAAFGPRPMSDRRRRGRFGTVPPGTRASSDPRCARFAA
eukprot:5262328-Alexandrium_andersonii.AAC.1